MIDVEAQVFTQAAGVLRAQFPGITVSGEYVNAPSAFPHVSLVEQDSYPVVDHLDGGERESRTVLMYEVNIYSDRTTGKKSQCRRILGVLDELLWGMNFRRLAVTPVPNLENATIYRLTAQYRVETDGIHFYRR